MTARQASPQRIGQLARSQWVIENRVHFVRDTAFAEDASKIRTGHGPENMATLRNTAINTLRTAGHNSIAAGLREAPYAPFTRHWTCSAWPDLHSIKITQTFYQPWRLPLAPRMKPPWPFHRPYLSSEATFSTTQRYLASASFRLANPLMQ